ncbi:SPOR domain-containing protein [Paramicrobacterium chengjingii]|uniref:SPOR domain-containing protein n=1 Tax=Paramicrobacterium chengjingii TaxID=2769067 RepID=A0ABX6YMH5_9MICO|nr:SPOR domain-containing protein [Microbacterium chengjingii]QPZ40059.1 SPOR domain-containing protein [Microbacterium chengjingii]
MTDDPSKKYWYNLKSGEVEHGYVSPSVDRVGPFDTQDEASHALDRLAENSRKWAEEEESER